MHQQVKDILVLKVDFKQLMMDDTQLCREKNAACMQVRFMNAGNNCSDMHDIKISETS